MPFIEFRQQLYALRVGENLLSADPSANVRLPDLPGDCGLGITVEDSGAYAWAVGQCARVTINGHPLTKDPVPLFSGDKIAIENATLVFPLVYIDDGNDSTPVMRGRAARPAPAAVAGGLMESDAAAGAVESDLLTRATPPVAERKVIGILRRMDNNHNYIIDGSGFRIGREKRCDLIIPDKSVSRLHAEISLHGSQYVLQSTGRVATKVNGKEVSGVHNLSVGDVIEIGGHEFAFIRRPATAEDLDQKGEVTPVRSVVADAPTVMPGKPKKGGSRAFNYVLFALLLGMLGLILLG